MMRTSRKARKKQSRIMAHMTQITLRKRKKKLYKMGLILKQKKIVKRRKKKSK